MIRISTRIWAGVLASFLLPLLAVASDKNDSSNNTSTATASTAKESATSSASTSSAAPAASIGAANDPLLRLLVSQGLMNPEDVKNLAGVPSAELRDRLLVLLLTKNKNALSPEDLNALKGPAAGTTDDTAGAEAGAAQRTGAPQTPPTPPPSGPIPAVAPIRVLQINPPKREGVIPTLSIGKNIHIQPYGFYKATVVYDTVSPYGNDFPLPGFIGDINGPDKLSEFHVKARALRLGSNFEWMDDSSKLVVTAKLETDFEGNFTRVNNRNISSIRSSVPSIRLGYGRLDYAATDKTRLNFLAGQDWTIFGSSTLPNLLETTGFGLGYGILWERNPQFRFGLNHNFDGFSLEPDVAVVLPAYGNLPSNVADQLGYGERQGADSARPEIQARLVGQFQLDHAPGVAPAQIIVSGVNSERDVVVLASGISAPTGTGFNFKSVFPSGARISSTRYAWTGEVQLPTRFLTLVAKYYNGSDLRYYFAGQLLGPFPDTTGLTCIQSAQSIDGSTTVFLGLRGNTAPSCNAPSPGAVATIAGSLPPRSQGGFVNVGLPLSRWANADPQGRNAGWQLYLHYGYDQVLARDSRREGGGRMKGSLAAGTLYYKLNPWVTFAVEESLYTTRAIPLTATGQFPSFQGRPMREINDFRSEIGPIFTF